MSKKTGRLVHAGMALSFLALAALLCFYLATAGGRKGHSLREGPAGYPATSHGLASAPPGARADQSASRLKPAAFSGLRVRVADESGRPWGNGGAKVYVSKKNAAPGEVLKGSTDEGGVVAFPNLGQGRWRLDVGVENRAKSMQVELVQGRWTEITVRFARSGALMLGVVREKGKGPLAGADVHLSPLREHSWTWSYGDNGSWSSIWSDTDEEGRYELHTIPVGRYTITVRTREHPNVAHHAGYVIVEGTGTIRRDLTIAPGAPADLRVHVVDGRGTPLAGTPVRLRGPYKLGSSTGAEKYLPPRNTNEEGVVEFHRIRGGTWRIDAWHHGLQRMASIELVEGGTTDITLALPHSDATMEGVVRDGHDRLIAKASVTLRTHVRPRDRRGWILACDSDSTGRYRFASIPPGRYEIEVWIRSGVTGKLHYPGWVDVKTGETIQRDLVIGQPNLSGRITDATTKRPIAGATVSRWNATATTDADGRYDLRDTRAGTFLLTVRKDGYADKGVPEVHIVDGVPALLDVALEPASTVYLHITDERSRPATGRFTIFDRPDPDHNSAKGQYGVGYFQGYVTTDGEGRAAYRRIPPGKVTIDVLCPGFGSASKTVVLKEGENRVDLQVHPDSIAQKAPNGPKALSGTVTDATTGDPIAGVRVSLPSPNAMVYTGSNGRFEFRGVQPGEYTVQLSKDGYGFSLIQKVHVKAGEETKLDVKLERAATLHLEIYDSQGRPVAGEVRILVNPLDPKSGRSPSFGTGIRADDNGRAVNRKILPGSYKLQIDAGERGKGQVDATLTPGENTLRIDLK